MKTGFKFDIHLFDDLDTNIELFASAQGYIYNCKVAEFRSHYEFALSNQEYSHHQFLKDDEYNLVLDSNGKKIKLDWIKPIPSQILRNGAYKHEMALMRYKKGLGRKPTFKNKSKKNSVLITKELFKFIPIEFNLDKVITAYRVEIGSKTKHYGYGIFRTGGKEFQLPNSITIKKIRNKFTISFACEDDIQVLTEKELIDKFSKLSYSELDEISCGIDRGVANPFVANGVFYEQDAVVVARLLRKAKHKKKYQKTVSRKIKVKQNNGKALKRGEKSKPFVKGEKIELSNNCKKIQEKISKIDEYTTNARSDLIHKSTHELVENEKYKLFVLEDLKVKNMTKKPKAKKVNGKWVSNRSAQKAGLNGSILNVGWGKFGTTLTYKAINHGKLVIKVPAAYTSQECDQCGCFGIRKEDVFHCQCGRVEYSGTVAANVVLSRKYDTEITLYTPFKKVKQILEKRLLDKCILNRNNPDQFHELNNS